MKATMYFDGGCHPNPGQMDIGLVFTGDINESYYKDLTYGTNNLAEWLSIEAGLEIAISHGITDIDIIGDSEVVVKQMNGEYKVNNAKFKPIHKRCKELVKQFDKVNIKHMLRGGNLAGHLIEERRI